MRRERKRERKKGGKKKEFDRINELQLKEQKTFILNDGRDSKPTGRGNSERCGVFFFLINIFIIIIIFSCNPNIREGETGG